MDYNIPKTGVPPELVPLSEKKTDSYALKCFQYIYSSFCSGNSSYYETRNVLFNTNRSYSSGDQDFRQYLDLLDIDGQQAYANIVKDPRPILPRIRQAVIDAYMQETERVICTSLNKSVVSRKERKRMEADFVMNNKEVAQWINDELGKIEAFQTKNLPYEDIDEMDLYFQLNDREKEELLMQQAINFVLKNNEWEPIVKRNILEDLFDTGMACAFTKFNSNGRLVTQAIKPEATIYGKAIRDDFKDANYFGHVFQLTICEARVMFPNVPEKTWYDIAKNYSGRSVNGYANPTLRIAYSSQFIYDYYRPYDDYKIEFMHLWYKTDMDLNYVEGKDSYGRKIFDIQNKVGEIKNPNKKAGQKRVFTALTGYWAIGTDHVFDWGQDKNQLRSGENGTRPNNDLEDLISPYAIIMPNHRGSMMAKSLAGMCVPSIKNMDMAIMRLYTFMSQLSPDGNGYNIDAINEIDLGQGLGKVNFIKMMQIKKQTGNYFYRSKNAETGEPIDSPIIPSSDPDTGKIEKMINIYNFELTNIFSYIGVNPQTLGDNVNPRLGLGVLQQQVRSSNNATAQIYDFGYVNIFKNVANQVAMRMWDEFAYGTPNEGYIKILGEENTDFIKHTKDITDSNYDVDIKISMSSEEKQYLEQNIQGGIQAGTLDPEDAIFIREVDDPKLATRYLLIRKRKKQKEAIEQSKATSDYNAQIQEQVAQANAQREIALKQIEQQTALEKERLQGEYAVDVQQLKIIESCITEAMKTGKEVPKFAEALMQRYMAKIGTSVKEDQLADFKVDKSIQQVQQQEMQEQQQMQMQQQQEEQQIQ